jgi:hypothetical protein
MNNYQVLLQQWHTEEIRQRRIVFIITCIASQAVYLYSLLFLSAKLCIPYHTSALSGEAWIYELMIGHPDRIRHNLGVTLEVFEALVQILQQNGIHRSRNGISVEEQLGIFLYTCVTELSTRHLGERFQRTPDTITR